MIVSTEGVVLKSFDFRETSRITTFFTPQYGKVKGVLKGIRKDPKKFGSNVDRFSYNDIVYYQYRRSDLHLISQCDMKQYYFPIREDYKRNMAANYGLELVDAVMPLEQKNTLVFQLILNFLETLQTIDDIDKLVHVFQLKMLSLSGFRPHVDSCVKCHAQVHYRALFSMKSGGLICAKCPNVEEGLVGISPGTIASILYIENNDWDAALRLGLPLIIKKELKHILNNFLVYHLEKKIKTARYV